MRCICMPALDRSLFLIALQVRVDAEDAIKVGLEDQIQALRATTDENYEASLVLLEGKTLLSVATCSGPMWL